MNIVAITAEYNPFHNGHRYMLQQVRNHLGSSTVIVVIMSGSFVQRGEPALVDKWTRAAWAIQNGADCVVELPSVYALSSADGFAAGSVRLAQLLGCTHLSCGVENGCAADYQKLASLALSLPPSSMQHSGMTYGQKMTEALRHTSTPKLAALIAAPNSLLALEYVKAIQQYSPHMNFLPILRQTHHNSYELMGCSASSSAIRQAVNDNASMTSLDALLPTQVYADLQTMISNGSYTDYDRYGDFIIYANRLTRPEKLRTFPAFTEGLENRWYRIMSQAATWSDALQKLKTRRYSYSRLCRMGAYTLLSMTQQDMNAAYAAGPAYCRVLALNQKGAKVIKAAKNNVPIVTKIASTWPRLSAAAQSMLAYDLRATDIQYFCRHEAATRLGRQDYYCSPLMIQ